MTPARLPWYSLVIGLAVVGAFSLLCWYVVTAGVSFEAPNWDRLMVVFNSVQAMAAAAVGALLGTTVQQARVDAAEGRAKANEGAAAKVAAARELIDGLNPPGGDSNDTAAALGRLLR